MDILMRHNLGTPQPWFQLILSHMNTYWRVRLLINAQGAASTTYTVPNINITLSPVRTLQESVCRIIWQGEETGQAYHLREQFETRPRVNCVVGHTCINLIRGIRGCGSWDVSTNLTWYLREGLLKVNGLSCCRSRLTIVRLRPPQESNGWGFAYRGSTDNSTVRLSVSGPLQVLIYTSTLSATLISKMEDIFCSLSWNMEQAKKVSRKSLIIGPTLEQSGPYGYLAW
jgi:hypothetical protein